MKFCVIGLGHFGYQIATVLAENGMEILAIDRNESIIASIRDLVTHAVAINITDEASLYSVGVDEITTVIVAVGENFSQSILITALLKKRLHIPYVITSAIDDMHKEILLLVGADKIVLPEQEIGTKLADNLSSPFADITRITKNFSVGQISARQSFINKSIQDNNIFKTYKLHCIGKKENETIVPVAPEYIIQKDDKLIFAGNNADLERVSLL